MVISSMSVFTLLTSTHWSREINITINISVITINISVPCLSTPNVDCVCYVNALCVS